MKYESWGWVDSSQLAVSNRFQRFWFTLSLRKRIWEKMVRFLVVLCCLYPIHRPVMDCHYCYEFTYYSLRAKREGCREREKRKVKKFARDIIQLTRKHKNVKCEWNESFLFFLFAAEIVNYCNMSGKHKTQRELVSFWVYESQLTMQFYTFSFAAFATLLFSLAQMQCTHSVKIAVVKKFSFFSTFFYDVVCLLYSEGGVHCCLSEDMCTRVSSKVYFHSLFLSDALSWSHSMRYCEKL